MASTVPAQDAPAPDYFTPQERALIQRQFDRLTAGSGFPGEIPDPAPVRVAALNEAVGLQDVREDPDTAASVKTKLFVVDHQLKEAFRDASGIIDMKDVPRVWDLEQLETITALVVTDPTLFHAISEQAKIMPLEGAGIVDPERAEEAQRELSEASDALVDFLAQNPAADRQAIQALGRVAERRVYGQVDAVEDAPGIAGLTLVNDRGYFTPDEREIVEHLFDNIGRGGQEHVERFEELDQKPFTVQRLESSIHLAVPQEHVAEDGDVKWGEVPDDIRQAVLDVELKLHILDRELTKPFEDENFKASLAPRFWDTKHLEDAAAIAVPDTRGLEDVFGKTRMQWRDMAVHGDQYRETLEARAAVQMLDEYRARAPVADKEAIAALAVAAEHRLVERDATNIETFWEDRLRATERTVPMKQPGPSPILPTQEATSSSDVEPAKRTARRDPGLFVSNPAAVDEMMGGKRDRVEAKLGHAVERIVPAKMQGEYRGVVVAADATHIYQAIGREKTAVVAHDRGNVTEFVGKLSERNDKNDLVGRNVEMFYRDGKTKAYPFNPERLAQQWEKEDRFETVSRIRQSAEQTFDRQFGPDSSQRRFFGNVLDESINRALTRTNDLEAKRTVTEKTVQQIYDEQVERLAKSPEQAKFLKDALRETIRKTYAVDPERTPAVKDRTPEPER
jgi:hypothetical protein